MTYFNPVVTPLIVTIMIFLLSSVTQKTVIKLILWYREYSNKSNIVNHRKVKRKKLNLRPKYKTYIGQKVKRKSQKIGRKFHFTSRRHFKSQRKHKITRLYTNLGYHRKDEHIAYTTQASKFDTDSYLIGIDNHSSVSISNSEKDFIARPRPCIAKIKSFGGGTMKASGIGSVAWNITDDQGHTHRIIIHDVLYVPQAQVRLLCPQQWSQQVKSRTQGSDQMISVNTSEGIVFYWNNGRSTKTIPWSEKTNTAYMRTATGFDNAIEFSRVTTPHLKKLDTSVVYKVQKLPEENINTLDDEDYSNNQVFDLDLDSIGKTSNDSPQEIRAQKDEAELLRWHHRLSHLSFKRLKLLCLIGILPRRLANVPNPKCLACIYGKLTRKPWRTKSSNSRIKVTTFTQPGECVSVDQLVSPVPGFVAQLKGRLTKTRYRAATIFVDHASRFGYVHLQPDLTSRSTVQAKQAFENYAAKSRIKIKHYHCDNGRFADNAFKDSAQSNNQTVSYCGVNAHFQNGIAKKRIRDLQESARTMLIHVVLF